MAAMSWVVPPWPLALEPEESLFPFEGLHMGENERQLINESDVVNIIMQC